MELLRRLSALVVAAVMTIVLLPGAAQAAPPPMPTLVGIRAAHHPTFDRIVFDFAHGLPAAHHVSYVPRLIHGASGEPVPIAGRAILAVRFDGAQAHDDTGRVTAPDRVAFALPNIMTAVQSSDFEGVTSYGIGLAKRERFSVRTLTDPDRVVIDVRSTFRTVWRQVHFLDEERFRIGREPYFVPVWRPVRPRTPATGVMDRLFAGPLPAERAAGLRFVPSGATGFTDLRIGGRVAHVRLTGGCSSGGSTVTIAGHIQPTLKQFHTVDAVKIYDPAGTTGQPHGVVDSIPECLEP